MYYIADINLYQDDCDEFHEEGADYFSTDSHRTWSGIGEDISASQKMERCMDSDNIFFRQLAARNLMETLRSVGDNSQEAAIILSHMVRLSEDADSTVRADLMEQVPHLAMHFQEYDLLVPHALPQYILPIITKYLVDSHNQVRKTSQAALLVLLEQELIHQSIFEEHVCPVILDLSSAASIDDFRTEAVALMSKMAPLVGRCITERIFMPRFAEMCTDALFHVRKVCAANFGSMCAVIGEENVQKHLLSKFICLCEDGVWGVRKACAECFMDVACACSLSVRRTELTALFVNLISDTSRWVRIGAFQALGGFISTFADPSITGLYFSDEGILVAGDPSEFVRNEEMDCDCPDPTSGQAEPDHASVSGCHQSEDQPETFHLDSSQTCANDNVESDIVQSWNSFIFWRTPLPELDGDLNLINAFKTCSIDEDSDAGDATVTVNLPQKSDMNVQEVSNKDDELSDSSVYEALMSREQTLSEEEAHNIGSQHVLGQSVKESSMKVVDGIVHDLTSWEVPPIHKAPPYEYARIAPSHNDDSIFGAKSPRFHDAEPSRFCDVEVTPIFNQDIVPEVLLEHYVSMSDPLCAQSVDADIAQHCAYNLPAVAYTLGRQHWPCLRDLYETLANDMRWKVRRTLAFSLHELAVIVGADITHSDLVPIFNGFLKDLDEVRIGVLRHLADFLTLLTPPVRDEYLTRLREFLNQDNVRNWRFREDLAAQLLLLLPLFSPEDVHHHLLPVAISLAEDKVSQVRAVALQVIAAMVRSLWQAGSAGLVSSLLAAITARFSRTKKWAKRQVFADFCAGLLSSGVPPPSVVGLIVLPPLLPLASDPIPNVRLATARCLARHVLNSEYMTSPVNPLHEDLMTALHALQQDADRDVRACLALPTSDKLGSDAGDCDDVIPV